MIASHSQKFIIATMPTGSGKTWVQGLLAKHYCMQGNPVAIIEPNETLRVQASEKVGPIDYGISCITMEHFYKYGCEESIVIIDEYDCVVSEQPYAIHGKEIKGLWQLKPKAVIAFSATSSSAIERVVCKGIAPPLLLKFKSEYELATGISPIQDGKVQQCMEGKDVFKQLFEAVAANYENRPIVVVCNSEQIADCTKHFAINKYRHQVFEELAAMHALRTWDYGILLLAKEHCRGLDTRFAKDALVLIAADVENYAQYLQILGRASRSRGLCEGILFVISKEKGSVIMERLKTQNFAVMAELENLLKLLEKRAGDAALVGALKKSISGGK